MRTRLLIPPARLLCLLALVASGRAQTPAPVPAAAELKSAHDEVARAYAGLLYELLPEGAHAALVDRSRSMPTPAARYLLLREALELATKSGRVSHVDFVIDALVRAFAVDEYGLRDGALRALSRHPEANHRALALAYVGLAVRASRDGDAGRAGRRVAAALDRARSEAIENGDHALAAQCDAMRPDFAVRLRAFQALGGGDGAKLGRFRCFFEGDWQGGLPLLEPGDAAEQNILASKKDADRSYRTCLSLAESWLSRAKRYESADAQERSLVWRNLAAHALQWYYLAWPTSDGVERERLVAHMDALEARLQHGPAPGRVRFSGDGMRQMIVKGGASRVEEGVLILTNEGPAMSATCRYAYTRIRSVTIRGGIRSPANLNFRFAVGPFNALCNWEVRPENHFFLNDRRSHTKGRLLQHGKEHVFHIRQIGDEVVLWLDGRVAFRGKARLGGTVSVYPSLRAEIFVRELLIDGDLDPESKVDGPLRKLW